MTKTASPITNEPWGKDVIECLPCERVAQALRESHGSMGLIAIGCSACQSATPMMTRPEDAVLLWNNMQEGYLRARLHPEFVEALRTGRYSDSAITLLGEALEKLGLSLPLTIRFYRAFQIELDKAHAEWQLTRQEDQ